MRYHKLQISRTVFIALAAVTAGAVLSAVALSGLPASVAFADPYGGTVTLGVDAETAVVLGPEVTTDVKFESDEETSVPDEVEHALLLTGTAKAVAPVAAKPAVRQSVAAKPHAKRVSRKAPARTGGWHTARVSWYGPGFYGNTMAGGGTLRPDSMVVAHRSLPFGTKVQFRFKGRSVTAVVKDRGPYVGGRQFDLGPGTAKAFAFSGVGNVQYKIVGR